MSRLSRVANWKRLRLEVLLRDGWRCRYCGGYADTADHVVPRREGGGHRLDNLVACCRNCQYESRRPSKSDLFFRSNPPSTTAVDLSLRKDRDTSHAILSGDYGRHGD